MHRLTICIVIGLTLCACQALTQPTFPSVIASSIAAPDPELGSADYRVEANGDGTYSLLAENAENLKGVFVQLNYDPTLGHPQLVSTSGGFAADRSISLIHEVEPGRAQLAVALREYASRPVAGVTGAIALLRFVPEAPAAKTPSVNQLDVYHYSPYVDRAAKRLTLPHDLKGDYDQNGEVGISDLAPLARLLGSVGEGSPPSFDWHDEKYMVDGNADGYININDLTAIGANFGHKVTSYELYESDDFLKDYPNQHGPRPLEHLAPVATFGIDSLGGPVGKRKFLDVTVPTIKRGYYYLVVVRYGNGSAQLTWPAGAGAYLTDEEGIANLEYYDDDFGLSYDSGTHTVSWSTRMRGDSDRNTQINIGDLTVLGKYLNSTGPFETGSNKWLADSDRSGKLDVGDLDLLIAHEYMLLDDVRPYYSYPQNGPPVDRFADWGQALQSGNDVTTDYKRSMTVNLPSGSWIWVRPAFRTFLGPACGIQQIP